MPIVEKTSTTLVIQSRPLLEWLVGVAFIAGGAWASVSGERGFGSAFVLAGLVIIVAFANTTTIRFDRGTGRFTRTIKGRVRNTVIDHPLDAISGVRVEVPRSHRIRRASPRWCAGLSIRATMPRGAERGSPVSN